MKGSHNDHQMTLTSLIIYSEAELAGKFSPTRARIISLLQEHKEGMTDSELGEAIHGTEDLNINRPRRNDLSSDKGKFQLVSDSGKLRLNRKGHNETVWVLNKEKLIAYMG